MTEPRIKDDQKVLLTALGGTAFLGLIAYGLSLLFKTPLAPQFHWSLTDTIIGLVATAPLGVFLLWFMRTNNSHFAKFRQSQIEFFANIGFEFTLPRMMLMALFAGIFEELLFRGVFQTALASILPAIAAILISSIAFGVVHWRTALYALIAGLIGAWLGIIFWLTDNLLVPMVTHGVYDLYAFMITARAIQEYRATAPVIPPQD